MATSYPYMMVFVGPEAPHIIRLLLQKHDDSETGHYETCTSYAGFLERSYFCDQCNKGFDHNDFRHHPCEGRRCHACKQVECGAKPDYAFTQKYPVILVAESFTVRRVMTCIKRKRSATALFNALCVVRSFKPQRQKNLTNATLTNAPYAMNM